MKTIILLLLITIGLNAQTYKKQELVIITGDVVATDTVIQLDGDVGGKDWSMTIESDACDSVMFDIGGSNYEINKRTHLFAFEAVLQDTFIRAANFDTINGVGVEVKTYTGTKFPYSVPCIRYYKHATASDTINIILKHFR